MSNVGVQCYLSKEFFFTNYLGQHLPQSQWAGGGEGENTLIESPNSQTFQLTLKPLTFAL